jgi:hypothetical protein
MLQEGKVEEIKVGDLMFVKTTGEPVQVLSTDKGCIEVRRPVATRDNGIQHKLECFNSYELETDSEKLSRSLSSDLAEYNRQMKLVELTSPKPAKAEPVN